jgi:hypothetical protein
MEIGWLISISYYWRIKLGKEASILVFKIGCWQLVPAVGIRTGKSRRQKSHGSKKLQQLSKQDREFLCFQFETIFQKSKL